MLVVDQPAGRSRSYMQTFWCLAGLCAAIVYMFAAIRYLIPYEGLWLDELYSLEASDPTKSFRDVFWNWIISDNNLPMHYVLLYGMRSLIADDRVAFLVLNLCFLLCGVGAILWCAVRSGMTRTGLIIASLLLGLPPILIYVLEGRAYTSAFAFTSALSFVVSAGLEQRFDKFKLSLAGVLAFCCAMSQVYGLIYGGAIGVAALVVGLALKRRDLITAALVICLVVGLTFVIWLGVAAPYIMGKIQVLWIKLEFRDIVWYIAHVGLGQKIGVVLLAGLIAGLALRSDARPHLFLFAGTLFFFVAGPLLVSFLYRPIIVGRYWLVGVPGLLIILAFALRAVLIEPKTVFTKKAVLTGMAALWCALTIGYGVPVAREMISMKPIWRSAPDARAGLEGCSAPRLRVSDSEVGYRRLLGMPNVVLEPSDTSPEVEVSDMPCRAVGWNEHVRDKDWSETHDLQAALRLLRLTNKAGIKLEYKPQSSGYVILKAPE